jgi:hypothetical protein
VSTQHWRRGLDRPILMTVGAGLAGGRRARRRSPQPAGIDANASRAGAPGGREPHPRGGHAQPAPPPSYRRQGLRAGLAALQLDLFGDLAIASDTVACFRVQTGLAATAVVRRMRDAYGILVSTGIEGMRESVLRVGTMGMTASPLYVLPTLSARGMALRDLGYPVDPCEALAAAQAVFDAESP